MYSQRKSLWRVGDSNLHHETPEALTSPALTTEPRKLQVQASYQLSNMLVILGRESLHTLKEISPLSKKVVISDTKADCNNVACELIEQG